MDSNILIITRNFPPLVGGMERLMEHTVGQLTKHYNCTLIGPCGCDKFTPPLSSVRSCRIAPLPLFLIHAIFHTIVTGANQKYLFSLSGSGLTAPMSGMAKLLYRIPAITFVHGLDLVIDNSIYKRFFLPWLRYMDLVIVNSNNTARLAESKGVAPDKIRILHPGVNLPLDLPAKDKTFLTEHGLVGKNILLSVGRLVPRKGLAEFLQHSFPDIVAACPETVLLIIGSEPENSLKHDHGTRRRIEKIACDQGLVGHLCFLGKVDDSTLSKAYGAADLFIFPVLDIPGDVEGFGMVAIEAAAHGLPTLAFAAGGVTDAIHDQYSGFLVNSGNYQDFSKVAINYLNGNTSHVTKENCREFASRFEWNLHGAKLVEICTEFATP